MPVEDEQAVQPAVCFVVCAERGTLARKAQLLIASLRTFGGRFRDAPVLSYSPRPGRAPSTPELDRLSALGAEVVTDPLNRAHGDDGFANKIVACADAAGRSAVPRLVFLDSDIVVLDEPMGVWSAEPSVVKLTPVERKLAGSTGSDEHAEYWHRLHAWAGIEEPRYVRTALDHERIFAYWNAGVVSADARSGFFARWMDNYARLTTDGVDHPLGRTFLDQVALAVTAQTGGSRVEALPSDHNAPVSTAEAALRLGPGSAVLAHYHHLLDHRPISNPLCTLVDERRAGRLDGLVRTAGLAGPGAYAWFRIARRLGPLVRRERP